MSTYQELLDIIECALVPDLLQYHSQEWIARARRSELQKDQLK